VQLDFNGCTLTIENGDTLTIENCNTLTIENSKAILNLKQKGQGGKIKLVDIKAHNRAQQYMEQRARGAYIALTC
jgi:hypothetical protein